MNTKNEWFWDGYTDWERHLADDLDGEDPYSPVFLRLKAKGGRAEFLAALAKVSAKTIAEELAYLAAFPAQQAEAYAYVKTADLKDHHKRKKLEEAFYLLDVGASVVLAKGAAPAPLPIPQKTTASGPVVAIVDDGIGFLNRAFCKDGKTRFGAFWMQASERESGDGIALGRVLEADEIDDILANPALDEPAAYQHLNDELLPVGAQRSTGQVFSHGSHVLDLAAGAAPETPDYQVVKNWPLLAVQLPPGSVADTSGNRFEAHMVMAVRWILAQVQMRFSPLPQVVINLSFGMMAGPKNGTKFVEYQIAQELARFPQAQVVYAYGNGYRSQQVAQITTQDQSLNWVIQPDDFAPSYVEIMGTKAAPLPAGLEISLSGPAGQKTGYIRLPEDGSIDISPTARLYHVGPRMVDASGIFRPAHYMIALAPTASRDVGARLASAGVWEIRLRCADPAALDISLQIQRGDTAPGYGALGRQSYFEDAHAYGWDPETQDYTAPSPQSALRRAGTHSAMSSVYAGFDTSVRARMHTVGGAVLAGAGVVPARYSSSGEGDGPSDSAISDDGFALTGVLASGTYSGTVQQMNGTSVAAPRITRDLAHKAAGTNSGKTIANAKNLDRLSASVLVEPARGRR